LFDLSSKSEFVETIIGIGPFHVQAISFAGYCVDQYINSQVQAHDGVSADLKQDDQDMLQDDSRMEDVVNRMFARCLEEKNYKHVI
jgi:hypothetical protein